jgi:hypothetical protein
MKAENLTAMPNTNLSQILFFLWVTWAVLLFGGLIGKPDADRTRWTRMASSLALVIAAWSYALLYRERVYVDVVVLIAVGMAFCFIGDLFMAQLILQDDRHILGGIGAFGLGHMAYIAAFLRLLSHSQLLLDWRMNYSVNELNIVLPQSAINGMILIGCWLFATVIWYWVIYRAAKERTTLHLAALPYALLLATTVGTALNLTLYAWDLYNVSNATQAVRASMLLSRGAANLVGMESSTALLNLVRISIPALGTLLFFISDFILAARLFNKAYFHMIDDWVWLTYGPGQMLIVYGVGLFLFSL